MTETNTKNTDFMNLYNKSYRLAAAVFAISNVIENGEELRTKIKNLSLELVSMSVKLKDTDFYNSKKTISDIERHSLELMSMLDIASISGLVSKMNTNILKEEFESFIKELGRFENRFDHGNLSVKNILGSENALSLVGMSGAQEHVSNQNYLDSNIPKISNNTSFKSENTPKTIVNHAFDNGNSNKRKNLRKNAVHEFVKGHDGVSIKDIVPNIVGCSEKTVQRELTELIRDGKIRKVGERRWSRYFINER